MLDQQILEAIRGSFTPVLQDVNLEHTLGRHYYFREPTVDEQKAMSKIAISNSDSQSAVYATTLAYIKLLAMDKSFDQYALDEFDRINILAHLFSSNFFTKQLTINCPADGCGHSFPYSVRHGDILRELNRVDRSDILFENETDYGWIKVRANYPTVRRYLNFLEAVDAFSERERLEAERKSGNKPTDRYEAVNSAFDAMEKRAEMANEAKNADGSSKPTDLGDVRIAQLIKRKKKTAKDAKSVMGNVDMAAHPSDGSIRSPLLDTVDLYIKTVDYKVNNMADDVHIDFSNFEFDDVENVLGVFPSSFLVDRNGTRLADFLTNAVFERQKTVVPKITCPKCGCNITERLRLQDFFTAG